MSSFIKILAVSVVVLAGSTAVVLRGADSLWSIFRSASLGDFLSGTLSGKVDRAVFDAIPRSSALDGLGAGLLYKVLRDAGPQVRAGCGNWLYSMEELRQDRQDVERISARAKLLRHLADSAAKRGVLLVAVPVPDKAQQVAGALCGLSAEQSDFRDRAWAQASKGIGFPIIDLRASWPEPGYWRTDTHWDQVGAGFAANAVAKVVERAIGAGSQRVRLARAERRERSGDLARLSELTHAPRWLRPAPEYEEPVKAEIERSGSLLDDAPSPSVVLAGSSFSLNSGFIDYLQASLSREVAQMSEAGGGFAGSLLSVLRKPDMLKGVTVLIWEWPMRSLVAPLTDAERQALESMKGLS